MKYKPRYAKGQVLVAFKADTSTGFARTFGRQIGFELAEEDYEHGSNIFVYQTPIGQEKQAIKVFKKYQRFVEWAEKRDMRLEKRWDELEGIIEQLKELVDNANTLGNEEYKKRRENLAQRLVQPEEHS